MDCQSALEHQSKMKKPIKGKTVFRHWSEFEEHPDRYISGIEFRPEENLEWNYEGCPPYMVAYVGHDVDNAEFYLIPPAMAFYAATHQGWTREGRKNVARNAREELQAEQRALFGISEET